MTPALRVRNLCVSFPGPDGDRMMVVEGVDFDVAPHEVLGIVGESGAGKSMTVMATLGLVPPSARVSADVIEFEGQSFLDADSRQLRWYRNRKIGVVFQDPMTSLNPTFTIGYQIGRTLRMFDRSMSRSAARARAVELLELVGITNAERRLRQYPHEFSGGMRQRAMIAMAIANNPSLIIADEPTTALDVTIQSQILDVLERAAAATGAATILVTHDLGVVAETADRVMVMYAGRVVEQAPSRDFFGEQRHFYSRALLASLPSIDVRSDRMIPIPGTSVSAAAKPSGCAFHPRCPVGQREAVCSTEEPGLIDVGDGHLARCHFSSLVPNYDLEGTSV